MSDTENTQPEDSQSAPAPDAPEPAAEHAAPESTADRVPPPPADTSSETESPGARREEPPMPESIFLISYPKIVFMYPTFLVAIIAGILMAIFPGPDSVVPKITGMVFLIVLTINLVVLSFDFPRTTSLTLFFLCAALILGGVLILQLDLIELPQIIAVVTSFSPEANYQFYLMFAAALGVIFVGVGISVKFDYWEVRPNELLHHHGVLSDLERFAAPNLRIDKEINDVFEYLLLKSGRLILHPSNERKAIVLENVFFINRKEQQITRMLGALQVQVRDSN